MDVPSKHIHAVIIACRTGCLMLWPFSRENKPKQFIDVLGGGTMIESAITRIRSVVPPENIHIITNAPGEETIRRLLPWFPAENIFVEPISRNTAPCIALATAYIGKRDPEAIMVTVPADLLVLDEPAFMNILKDGIAVAHDRKSIVTIGVAPDRPETEYGYIQADKPRESKDIALSENSVLFSVKTFAEKPDAATAREFLDSGDFYWNSGVYIWHIDAINREFKRSMPDLYKDLQSISEAIGSAKEHEIIEDVYSWIHPVSIAYGIMEHAESVCMLAGDFGWADLGSWDDVLKTRREDIETSGRTEANVVQIDASNNFIKKSREKAVAVIGLENIIVIDTKDALLICNKGSAHDVRKVIDILRREGLDEYL